MAYGSAMQICTLIEISSTPLEVVITPKTGSLLMSPGILATKMPNSLVFETSDVKWVMSYQLTLECESCWSNPF